MQTRLTLRMEEPVIGRAKAWTRTHGVSLSDLVAAYLASLDEASQQDLAPCTRRLTGVARQAVSDAGKPNHGSHLPAKWPSAAIPGSSSRRVWVRRAGRSRPPGAPRTTSSARADT